MTEYQEPQHISPTLQRTEQYKMMLLESWRNIKELAVQVRSLFFRVGPMIEGDGASAVTASNEELDMIDDLISQCIDMWEELRPKMKGKGNEEFMKFDKVMDTPMKLKEDGALLFNMIRVIRDALEDLDITSLPVKEN